MPFTLSHAAVALPLLGRLRWLEPVAFVIGTMVPDLGYYIDLGGHGSTTHSLRGSFLGALPQGLVVWLLLCFFGRSASELVPEPFRSPLHRVFAAMSSPRQLLSILPSMWLGIASHNFIDSFTHRTGWFAVRVPLLQHEFVDLPYLGALPVYQLLQYLGSIGGLGLLAVFGLRYWQANPETGIDKPRLLLLLTMAVASAVLALRPSLAKASAYEGWLAKRVFVVETVVTCTTSFVLLFCLGSLIWSALTRLRA